MQRGRRAPKVVDSPCQIQQVVVLAEIVGGLVPQRAVGQAVTLGGPSAVPVGFETLVQTVVFAQSQAVHVGIGAHTVIGVHAVVVIACRHAVPCLPGLLIVANVLVAQFQRTVVVHIRQSAVITSALSTGSMHITVRAGVMIGAVQHPVISHQAGRELSAGIVSAIRAIGGANLCRRDKAGRGRAEHHASAKSAVAVGGGSHSALHLHAAQQCGIRIHVGPEHTLVLGRIQRHTVQCHIDAAVTRTTQAHVGGSRAQTVLAPCRHTRSAGQQEGKFLAGTRKLLHLFLPDTAHGKRRILLRFHSLHHNLTQFIQRNGIGFRLIISPTRLSHTTYECSHQDFLHF